MRPVAGHPYVWAWHGPCEESPTGYLIRMACTACGRVEERECRWPGRADAWIALFCWRHCHDQPHLAEPWFERYATLDQAFKMALRGY